MATFEEKGPNEAFQESSNMLITVPVGAKEGTQLQVHTKDGRSFTIAMPPGPP